MSPWKSRWSRVRFVKTATSKRQPSTRSSASAWEETSIAAARVAVGDHLGQQLLDQRRLRRGAVRLDAAAPRAIAHRAEEAGARRTAGRGSPRAGRRRGLAVGARHAREHELLGRVSVQARRQQRERPARRGDGDPGRRDARRGRPVADDGDGAAGNGVPGRAPGRRTARRGSRRRGRPARPAANRPRLRGPRDPRAAGSSSAPSRAAASSINFTEPTEAVPSPPRDARPPGPAPPRYRRGKGCGPSPDGPASPAGGSWATTNPVPCRRARTPMRAKTASASRADIPRALGVRPAASAGASPSLEARRAAVTTPLAYRGSRGAGASASTVAGTLLLPRRDAQDAEGLGHHLREQRAPRRPRSSTCPADLRAPRRRRSAGASAGAKPAKLGTWRPAPYPPTPAFCAVPVLPATGKPGIAAGVPVPRSTTPTRMRPDRPGRRLREDARRAPAAGAPARRRPARRSASRRAAARAGRRWR